ncbi:MAG: rlmN 2 [Fibrobacteria bacterium]|nr:rlmN 2 [Fibrobacteria bacterium]
MSSPLDILGLTHEALCAEMGLLHEKPGKGTFHGDAVFQALYRHGTFDPASLPAFEANPRLAQKAAERFRLAPPPVTDKQGDGDTYKFLMKLEGGLETESVVIPMRQYKTLCVSSQVGCKMGCRFCETAQMGFLKNLTSGEIVAQVFTARKILNEPIENIVFMGMGEPTDNLDAVITAVRILADQRGLCIPLSSITISTVGNVPGILRLAELAQKPLSEGGLRHLRLAVSLNAPTDGVRDGLMPVNGSWDMAELKAALQRWPLPRPQDFIFAEYVLIAGVNDSREDALALAEYLRGLRATVNLIPYNPRRESPYARPAPESVSAFFRALMDAGQACRIRGTKGDSAMAACGQLGNRALSRRRRAVEAAPSAA